MEVVLRAVEPLSRDLLHVTGRLVRTTSMQALFLCLCVALNKSNTSSRQQPTN